MINLSLRSNRIAVSRSIRPAFDRLRVPGGDINRSADVALGFDGESGEFLDLAKDRNAAGENDLICHCASPDKAPPKTAQAESGDGAEMARARARGPKPDHRRLPICLGI